MTRDLGQLFESARLLPAAERAAFVDEACAGDEALRAELESLLRHADDAERFFGRLGDAVRDAVPALDREAAREAASDASHATGASDASASFAWWRAAAAEAESARDPVIGRTIGHYRVLALLGRGGMGAVYRARDERLEREVALKFLPPHLATDPSAARQLLREARAAAGLSHPNVCTVYEIGETDDRRPYISMALCEGETLKQRLTRGPLPPADAVAIARELAGALRTAHAAGVVHRDVKPGNVMIAHDGTSRLLDFGLARIAGTVSTARGRTPGTLAYMSPEQVRGTALDHRSDLWSLGVVLHEMLAGERPFRGAGVRAVMHAILHDEPAPLPTLPHPALRRVVERLLRKEPGERYPDAAALDADLARALSPEAAPAAPGGGRRRATRVVAGVALLAAAVGGGLWAASRPAPVGDGRSLVVLPFVNMSADSGTTYFSDGLTDELITRLGEVPELKVISRTSAMHYRAVRAPLKRIAAELGVAHVVEGSVRRGDGRLRVTAQLIDARTDVHRWSASYDVAVLDAVQVQERIAREVVRALQVELGQQGERRMARRGTRDPEAYDLYRRGRYFWNSRTPEGHAKAIAYLERAIARDTAYADAHAGLADAYLTDYQHTASGRSEAELSALHRAAAERAIALDPGSPDARVAYAVSLWWRRDWPGAERELRRALAANPGDARAHNWYSLLLMGMGRLGEAGRESARAVELDPFAPNYPDVQAWQHALAGQFAKADDLLRKSLEMHRTYPNAHRTLSLSLSAQGRHAEAVREIRKAIAIAPGRREYRGDLAYVLARSGATEEARAALRDAAPAPGEPFNIARAWIALGQLDSAFVWLERSSWHWPHRAARADPALEPVRRDPRFARLSQRVERELGLR